MGRARVWQRFSHRRHRNDGVTLGVGESAIVALAVPADLVSHPGLQVRAHWVCGGCGRRLHKDVPAVDAATHGIAVACPLCDPDEVMARGVEEDAP